MFNDRNCSESIPPLKLEDIAIMHHSQHKMIAACIKSTIEYLRSKEHHKQADGVESFANEIVYDFKKDNHQFIGKKFLRQCGIRGPNINVIRLAFPPGFDVQIVDDSHHPTQPPEKPR